MTAVPLRRNRDFMLLQIGQLLSNVGTSTYVRYRSPSRPFPISSSPSDLIHHANGATTPVPAFDVTRTRLSHVGLRTRHKLVEELEGRPRIAMGKELVLQDRSVLLEIVDVRLQKIHVPRIEIVYVLSPRPA